MTLKTGDQVRKISGDYHLNGEVRAVFTTKAGRERFVVEHPIENSPGGILHIYGASNLAQIESQHGGKARHPEPDLIVVKLGHDSAAIRTMAASVLQHLRTSFGFVAVTNVVGATPPDGPTDADCRDELKKIARTVGEPDDMFAAWESIKVLADVREEAETLTKAAMVLLNSLPTEWHGVRELEVAESIQNLRQLLNIAPIEPDAADKECAERLEKQQRLWDAAQAFISANEVSCAENTTKDKVYEQAPQLVEELAEIVGYWKDPEDEEMDSSDA